MPKLSVFNATKTPSSVVGGRAASAADFGSGAGLIQGGKDLAAFGAKLEEMHERKSALHREETIANDRVKWSARLQELRDTLPHGGVGATEILKQEMEKYNETNIDTMGSNRAKEDYKLQTTQMKGRFLTKAIGLEAVASGKQERGTIDTVVSTAINSARANGDAEEGIEQTTRLIRGSRLPMDQQDKLIKETNEDIWAATSDGMLEGVADVRSAKLVEAQLREDIWKGRLGKKAYDTALTAAQRNVKHYEDKEEKAYLVDAKERIREEGDGVQGSAPTEDELRQNIHDPDVLNAALKDRRNAVIQGDAVAKVRGASPAEIKAMVQKAEKDHAEPGNRDADVSKLNAITRAVSTHQRRLAADPADYAAEVNKSVSKAVSTYTALAKNSPNNPEEKAEQKAAFNNMVAAQAAAQTHMGKDPRDVKILNNNMVNSLRAQLRGVDTEADVPDQVHSILKNMQESYGKHWTLVNKQLQEAKVFTGTESVVAGMTRPDQHQSARDLLIASRLTDDDISGPIKEFSKAKKTVADLVRIEMGDLTKSLRGVAGGEKQAGVYSSAINRLALYYMGDGTTSAADAVSRAAKSVVMDNYEFSGTLRLPTKEGLSLSHVEKVAAGSVKALEFSEIIPPASVMPGVPEDVRRKQYEASIKDTGRWVTNSDETGVILVDQNGRPVTHRTGELIERTWGFFRWSPSPVTEDIGGTSILVSP